ncbi:MAG: hypothetical protein B7Z73_16340 [Planctomycetia bacterium 21-64-5]|nr:MAG: hypothetical protein B7Z73_16340 [Planctomycetia bacterium 21-64-5]HQU43704.1 hypothetical protein [Pirellulales bacterium]
MLSRETLERYRRMTTAERLKLTMKMTDEATPYLLRGTPEQVDRRFELLRRQNNERNRRMLEGIARTRIPHEGTE